MGLIDSILSSNGNLQAATAPPDDDFWYTPAGSTISTTGAQVTERTALQVSTVWRCVAAVADDIAAMPLILYRRLADDKGRERATSHPLYSLLHDSPNEDQTAFEFREHCMVHLLLRGNAYSPIIPGPNGLPDGLAVPLNPDRMKVERLPSKRLRYTYQRENGGQDVYREDEIFHLRGLGSDGITGYSVIQYARNSLGLGIATESFGARYFSQDASPGGVLEMDGHLSPTASDRMKRDWERAHTGLQNSHRVSLLESGVRWKQVGLSNDDSQFLQTRSFQVEEIARWFGVPLHRIGHNEKSTSWGTGIEQFNLGYITYTLVPWLKRWEQRIFKDLIVRQDTFFAEFLVDHLLRGDQRARYTSYQSAINTGWMSRNEVRRRENLNWEEGLDEFLRAQNLAEVGDEDDEPESNPFLRAPGNSQPQEDEEPEDEGPEDEGNRRAVLSSEWRYKAEELAQDAAARIVRKEVMAIQKASKKYVGNAQGFEVWLREFYEGMETFIIESLHLSAIEAAEYVVLQRDAVLHAGPETLETWNGQQADYLAQRMLSEVASNGTA